MLAIIFSDTSFGIDEKYYRFSDLIKVANGLTNDADLENVKLIRSDGSIITFNPTKAINNPGTRHDPILVPDDQIIIPRLDNIVSIKFKEIEA